MEDWEQEAELSAHRRAKDKRLRMQLAGKRSVYWSPALNRQMKRSGTVHALYDGGTLCGAKPHWMGASYSTALKAGGTVCRRCQRIIDEVFPK